MYQLENLVQEHLPELHVHFQSQGFQTTMYASSWFLTLFTTTLNLSISCRVMDVFLSEGMEFIFKMALGMLIFGKEQLLSMDMEAMLKVRVAEDFVVSQITCNNFFRTASALEVLRRVLI